MADLGHVLEGIDTEPPHVQEAKRNLFRRIVGRLYRLGWDTDSAGEDLAGINIGIIDRIRKSRWDILWLDKGLVVAPETLKTVKELQADCVIIGYSPDDMSARHNQSPQFLRSLSLNDIYFTTKSYGVAELKALGCKRVIFCGNAYDPFFHKPVTLDEEDKKKLGGRVGFIGTWEFSRAHSMHCLARAGFHVRIWGVGWERCWLSHPNLIIEKKPLWGEKYGKAISSFDINLCFLRKINRDLQTTRSVEIPACGAFMLAERTEEHLSLFEEGKEAEFFGSTDELIEKVRYYLANPALREKIAAAGRQRCVSSGYDYPSRMRWMLEQA